jgi:hypothetical protein
VQKLLKNGNSDRIERNRPRCSDEIGGRQMCKKHSGWQEEEKGKQKSRR